MKQYKGNIYLIDDNFKTRISGVVLTIENDNFEIEFPDNSYRRSDYKIIQGEFIDLGLATLIDCTLSGSTMSVINLTKYRVQHIITDVKFGYDESIIASGLNVKMPALKEWFNESSLSGHLILKSKILVEDFLKYKNCCCKLDF